MNFNELNLSALTYFVDSIELGSLAQAAEKNHVSRPAVSKAIKRIEEIAGFEIIDHRKNHLRLTAKGRVFFSQAQNSLKAFAASFTHDRPEEKRLSVACSAALAEHLLLPALKKVSVPYLAKLSVRIGTTAKVRQLISDGEVQLGLLIDDGNTQGFNSQTVARGHFVLRSSSGRFKGSLCTTEPRPEVLQLQSVLKQRRLAVEQHLEIESWSTCRKAAEQIGGICLVPDFVKGLKPVRDPQFRYAYEVKAICKDLNHLTSLELSLIEVLKS